MPDYKWRGKKDPASFTVTNPEEAIRYWRSEYDRLSTLLANSYDDPDIDKNERDAMRHERNGAAARVVGFSNYVVP